MKRIAIILSGCGFKDGSECTETISSFIALSGENCEYECFAPDLEFTATDHISNQPIGNRNIRSESTRLSRKEVQKIETLNSDKFDALLFPGGFGAALHLSDWASKGSRCTVHAVVESLINNFYKQSKPIGAICIAPVLIAKVLGSKNNVTLTIGNDAATAEEIEKTGAEHVDCKVTDFVSDRASKILTTPAYMYDEAKACEVFEGIKGLVKELAEMA